MPRQANSGSFKHGYDPRRHLLTRADRQKGYRVATQEKKMPSRLRAWLRNKIRRHYQTAPQSKGGMVYHEFSQLEESA